ncbi:GGDEF domain-containing protein [Pseudoalteromonas sp. NBT06-2]|uniref:GGDEF domain-containing protein n=1 Tax=Pseudoalteromonas sp. NBT06-2 TaxID=2025950 RepID=UPI001482F725|nr:GGDEF domain-containing protein [Pseudoalteromonas sp. NBT06-2]
MLYLKKKDFEKSADFWLLADALFLGIEGPYAKSQHYLVQAQIEVNEKKATLASQAVLKAEQIILTLDQAKNLAMYIQLYDVKIDIAVLKEDYKTAFELQKKEKTLTDAYQNDVREEARSKYKVMFDTEQTLLKNKLLEREKQFTTVELENAKQEQQLKNMVIITAAILIAVLFFFFYRQRRTSKKLNRLANTDVLTQLANRRYTFLYSELELKKSISTGTAFSIIIFDIDHFKQVNDNYGHSAGDEVLINTAKTASKFIREQDILGRIGGEEFLAILSNTSLPQALEIAQRIRLAIETQLVSYDNNVINITASFGVAQFSPDKEDFISLFQHADKYLYKAKNQGRNCIVSE